MSRALTFASLLTLSLAGAVRSVSAADISVTTGTYVVNSPGDLGGNDVIVDNSANLSATLQVNSGATLSNGITLNNGGALVNSGAISRSGPGVMGDSGTVTNQTGGTITSTANDGIFLSFGGTITNNAGASITGAAGIHTDWHSGGSATVTNSGTITGTSDQGVYLSNGGSLTNQAGGTISGITFGASVWGGSVVNTGSGSLISASQAVGSAGVNLEDSGSVTNANGAQIKGYDGVQIWNVGSLTNSGGASIIANGGNGVWSSGGPGTVLNTGAGSTISGWWGVYLDSGGSVTNQNGATIIGTGTAAVYLESGGTVINGAGSFITSTNTINGGYGIYSTQNTTVSNAGTITGDVRLADQRTNAVTLFTGSRINGDLYVNTDSTSTLTLDGAGTQFYSQAVTGLTTFVNGVLTKQGTGTWIIDKDVNIFTPAISPGSTVISAGTLEVDATLPGAVTVQNGGTLAGTGKVRATTVQQGGIIAPGRSGIGTLNINGSFKQNAGSTYNAQIDPASTAADRISVTGAVTLSSGAVLNISRTSAVPYLVGTRYTVLTATGNISGTYTLTGDVSAFLGLTASYNAHNAYLDVVQARPLMQASATRTQFAIANSIQSQPTSNPLFIATVNLPTDAAARAAFNQLSGDLHASIAGALLDDSRFVRNAALDRLGDAFCSATPSSSGSSYRSGDANNRKPQENSACVSSAEHVTTWGSTFGSWGRNNGGVATTSLDRTIGGFLTGADMPVADTWRLGVLTGYSQSRFNAGSGSGSSVNYNLGLYGGTQRGNLAVRFGSAYTWHDITTNRGVAFSGFSDRLKAGYDAATTQVFGELGYLISVTGATFEPFANLAYVNVRTGGLTETGGLAALTGRAGDNGVTFTTLGLHASTDFTIGRMQMFAKETFGWRRSFGDLRPTSALTFAGGNAFDVSGIPVQQDAAVLDISLGLKLGRNTTLAASYIGQFSSGAVDLGAKANLSMRF